MCHSNLHCHLSLLGSGMGHGFFALQRPFNLVSLPLHCLPPLAGLGLVQVLFLVEKRKNYLRARKSTASFQIITCIISLLVLIVGSLKYIMIDTHIEITPDPSQETEQVALAHSLHPPSTATHCFGPLMKLPLFFPPGLPEWSQQWFGRYLTYITQRYPHHPLLTLLQSLMFSVAIDQNVH